MANAENEDPVDLNFECTLCGKCCQGLKVPLTVEEAIGWLKDENEVQILTEAIPWPDEPGEDDRLMLHKRALSFPVMSGSLPTRVVVVLAASFSGSCPYLQPDMRCGIYDRRPLTCRIHPAETSEFVELDPAHRCCPPEAWGADFRPMLRQGRIVDAELQDVMVRARASAVHSVGTKAALCAALGIDAAPLLNEGLAIYSPDRGVLLEQLEKSRDAAIPAESLPSWRYVSNRMRTVKVLASAGAISTLVRKGDETPFEYFGFFDPSE
jgi:Fe-S-cluster containining protein